MNKLTMLYKKQGKRKQNHLLSTKIQDRSYKNSKEEIKMNNKQVR